LKIAFRADASVVQGTGHVVRSLTLAREFQNAGHEVRLISNIECVPWLSKMVEQSEIDWQICDANIINHADVREGRFDILVVDSYQIPAEIVNDTGGLNPIMAIIDSQMRGLTPNVVLDHNIGAVEFSDYCGNFQLIGPAFALVRPEIRNVRRKFSSRVSGNTRPTVLVMMGGSDPSNLVVKLGELLSGLDSDYEFHFVTTSGNIEALAQFLPMSRKNIHTFTPDIQSLLQIADLAISAAGTSSLDLSCIGIPTIYISVAENQNATLSKISELKLGLTVGTGNEIENRKKELVNSLALCAHDLELRETLFVNSQRLVDGLGAHRVVENIKSALS